MSEMVERVARVLHRDSVCVLSLYAWDDLDDCAISHFHSMARAAIEAMREVDDEFLEGISARMWTPATSDNFETWPYQRTVIRAFVDEMLAEKQP